MSPRRSTASITLVLIGSAALYGCGEEVGQRDVYRSQTECMQDWGKDPAHCERQRSGNHAGYFYGPYYRDPGSRQSLIGTTPSPGKSSTAIGSTRVAKSASGSSGVSRSGFGASASVHGSSGS